MGYFSQFLHATPLSQNGGYKKDDMSELLRYLCTITFMPKQLRASYLFATSIKYATSKYVLCFTHKEFVSIEGSGKNDIKREVNIFHIIFGKKYNMKMEYTGSCVTGYSPGPGFYIIRKKSHIVIAKVSVENIESGNDRDGNTRIINFVIIAENPEKILIKYKKLMRNFFKHERIKYNQKNHKYDMMDSDRGNDTSINYKPFDEMIGIDKNNIDNIIERFAEGKSLYRKNHIRHKLGILLYGDTGTGKTSLCYAIAAKYQIPLICVTPKTIRRCISGDDYYSIVYGFANYQKGNGYKGISAIYLINEIDAVCNEESSIIKGNMIDKGVTQRNEFLTFIDSLPDDIIIIGTTNHFNKLDKALIRPGRFDHTIEMKYFDRDNAKEMISKYNIDSNFIDRYSDDDFPICPSKLEYDIISTICEKVVNNHD